MVAHPGQQGADTFAPFQGGHGHDALDAGIALRLLLDELYFLDILAAAGPEVGIAFQKHHRLDLQRAAVALVILDMVGVAIQGMAVEGGIFQAGLVPDVQMGVDDRKIGHRGTSAGEFEVGVGSFQRQAKAGGGV